MLGDDRAAELVLESIPVIDGAVELAGDGILPGGTQRNIEAMADRVRAEGIDDDRLAVLFDAQTSGGLLMAVAPDAAPDVLDRLKRLDEPTTAARIGRVVAGSGTISVLPR